MSTNLNDFKYYCCYQATNPTWGGNAQELLQSLGGEKVYAKVGNGKGGWYRPWYYYIFKSEEDYESFKKLLKEHNLNGLITLQALYPIETMQIIDPVEIKGIVDQLLEGKAYKDIVKLQETYGLKLKIYGFNDSGFGLQCNGTDYLYNINDLTPQELFCKFMKICTYSVGKAMGWINKESRSNGSYEKKKISGETSFEVNQYSPADRAKIEKLLSKEYI